MKKLALILSLAFLTTANAAQMPQKQPEAQAVAEAEKIEEQKVSLRCAYFISRQCVRWR